MANKAWVLQYWRGMCKGKFFHNSVVVPDRMRDARVFDTLQLAKMYKPPTATPRRVLLDRNGRPKEIVK